MKAYRNKLSELPIVTKKINVVYPRPINMFSEIYAHRLLLAKMFIVLVVALAISFSMNCFLYAEIRSSPSDTIEMVNYRNYIGMVVSFTATFFVSLYGYYNIIDKHIAKVVCKKISRRRENSQLWICAKKLIRFLSFFVICLLLPFVTIIAWHTQYTYIKLLFAALLRIEIMCAIYSVVVSLCGLYIRNICNDPIFARLDYSEAYKDLGIRCIFVLCAIEILQGGLSIVLAIAAILSTHTLTYVV
ncbi:hypothetical protein NEFER03_1972 [Nematocida sp. LUAm3]|nr:hypothetical protein NEFER03_1972 [Nematocida sp. LUAm3]KAI5176056.1 hypothetical protein NEFER02_1890 [Nematocida sp. LUAm2]KAI5177100.1 hypothetical protein NEFER01_0375 [Nematocida sp. LUAm1]